MAVETSQTADPSEEPKIGILIDTIEEENSICEDGINNKVCLWTLWYKGTFKWAPIKASFELTYKFTLN